MVVEGTLVAFQGMRRRVVHSTPKERTILQAKPASQSYGRIPATFLPPLKPHPPLFFCEYPPSLFLTLNSTSTSPPSLPRRHVDTRQLFNPTVQWTSEPGTLVSRSHLAQNQARRRWCLSDLVKSWYRLP